MNLVKALGYYFPTTVLFVDDDFDFLKGLKVGLKSHVPHAQLEENPLVAFDFLKKQFSRKDEFFIENIDEGELDQEYDCPINIPLSRLFKKASSSKRTQEISVIVVDYSMPQMTGLQLCEKLKFSPAKKIMLTGESDQKIAVEAFNKGVIDYFIPKTHPDLLNHLADVIGVLQQTYFHEQSGFILRAAQGPGPSFLSQESFLSSFNQFLKKFDINEFYLLDRKGSFAGVDNSGEVICFLVKGEDEMERIAELAEHADTPPSICSELKNRNKMVYFGCEKDQACDPSEWGKLAHTVVSNVDGYYFAYAKGVLKL